MLFPSTAADSGWRRTYGGEGRDKAFAMDSTPDGGYALAGTTDSFGAEGYDFWLFRTDEYGVVPEYWTLLTVSMLMVAILPIFIHMKNRTIRRAIGKA